MSWGAREGLEGGLEGAGCEKMFGGLREDLREKRLLGGRGIVVDLWGSWWETWAVYGAHIHSSRAKHQTQAGPSHNAALLAAADKAQSAAGSWKHTSLCLESRALTLHAQERCCCFCPVHSNKYNKELGYTSPCLDPPRLRALLLLLPCAQQQVQQGAGGAAEDQGGAHLPAVPRRRQGAAAPCCF